MLIATIKSGGQYFVEPVIDFREDGKVLVRLQFGLGWFKPFDLTHPFENALRRLPKTERCEIHFAKVKECGANSGLTIEQPSEADEQRAEEEWEASCIG